MVVISPATAIPASGSSNDVVVAATNEDPAVQINDISNDQAAVPKPGMAQLPISDTKQNSDKPILPTRENRRVFVTHGKNKNLVPQLKELLQFGQFDPVVSIERESVSKPVPDKVMDDMRSCGAAIIHVDAERELLTTEGTREIVLNPNVLIEIGAAMALYKRRFILLVQDGVRLPSNLQGLYEVRYQGEKLDGRGNFATAQSIQRF